MKIFCFRNLGWASQVVILTSLGWPPAIVMGAASYDIEECRIPVSPTVVVSFPGFGRYCERTSHVLVLGASRASQVSFTIPDKATYPWSPFNLEVPNDVAASLSQSPTESGRYLISSIGESFGTNILTLLWRWDFDCGIQAGEIDPKVLVPINVEARTPFGGSLPTDVIPGSFFDFTDGGLTVLVGKIYYSDGETLVPSAEVIIHSVGDIRMDSDCENRWCDNSFNILPYGEFQAWFFISGLEGELPAKVTFQAWIPGNCESRTEVMQEVISVSYDPPYRDIILPIPPPPPDPTPTPTEAPACVEPGNVIIYK